MSPVQADIIRDVPGFGRCFVDRCRFVDSGSPLICYRCASRTLAPLAKRRCNVCDRPLLPDTSCRNYLCGDRSRRWFTRNHAIAPDEGSLNGAIRGKYGPKADGFAILLARILLGYLDDNAKVFRSMDLIIASPAFVPPGGRDHVRRLLESADRQSPSTWPFDLADPPALIKTRVTTKLAGKGIAARVGAKDELVAAFEVSDRQRTEGLRVAVVDDLFTTGTTLDAAARVLLEVGGALEVVGISLARRMMPEDRAIAAAADVD